MSTLYIDRKGIQLKLDGGSIAFYENHERVGAVPLAPIERVVMRGDVQLAANILGDLGERGIGVLILSGRKCVRYVRAERQTPPAPGQSPQRCITTHRSIPPIIRRKILRRLHPMHTPTQASRATQSIAKTA